MFNAHSRSQSGRGHRPSLPRPKNRQPISLRFCAAAAAALLFSSAAHADSYNWTGSFPTGDWDAIFPPFNMPPGNWFDNTTNSAAFQVPGSADDVTFGSVPYNSFIGVNITGPHSVNSITFDTPLGFSINNSGDLTTALTLTSGSLIQTANDSGVQTISVPVKIGSDATWSLNGTGTIIVSQPVSSNNTRLGLTTTGRGNLILQGQNSYQGNTNISGSGTVTLSGSIGTAIGGVAPYNAIVDSQEGANFVLDSSTSNTSALITNDTVVGNQLTGIFTQNGGTHITKLLGVGYSANGNGTYNLNGGALTVTTTGTRVGGLSSGAATNVPTKGVFNQSGGLQQTAQLEIGASQAASGTYNLSGGALSVSDATFIGETKNSHGLFSQSGGQVTTQALVLGISIQYTSDPVIPGGWTRTTNTQNPAQSSNVSTISPAVQAAVTARYVLSGGTLTTEAIEGVSTGTEFDFNGGTLRPTINLNNFITGLDAAVVQAGGAVFDTNGFLVSVPQALVHDASLGATRDGGLTKNGDGFLHLTGNVAYTGPTVVNGGALYVPATTGLLSSTNFTSNVNGNLLLMGGTLAAGGSIIDKGTVSTTQFESDGTITIVGGTSGATFYDDVTDLKLATSSHTYVGSAATPGGNLTLQNRARIQLNGTLVNNGTITGDVYVNSGGMLSGNGHVGTVILLAGGTLHAGNSPGTMHAANVSLNANSTVQFDINSATGTPGTNWSLLAVDDELVIGGLQGKSPTILKLTSVAGQSDDESPLTDFDPTQFYSWQFASFNDVETIDDQPFQVDASNFQNATNGGKFAVTFADGSLSLEFIPVPEPTSVLLLWLAGLASLRRRRGEIRC